jgi:hypothetical protein
VDKVREVAIISSRMEDDITKTNRSLYPYSSLATVRTPLPITTLLTSSSTSPVVPPSSSPSSLSSIPVTSSTTEETKGKDSGKVLPLLHLPLPDSLVSILNESHRILCSADNVVGRLVDLAEPDHHDSLPHFEILDINRPIISKLTYSKNDDRHTSNTATNINASVDNGNGIAPLISTYPSFNLSETNVMTTNDGTCTTSMNSMNRVNNNNGMSCDMNAIGMTSKELLQLLTMNGNGRRGGTWDEQERVQW